MIVEADNHPPTKLFTVSATLSFDNYSGYLTLLLLSVMHSPVMFETRSSLPWFGTFDYGYDF